MKMMRALHMMISSADNNMQAQSSSTAVDACLVQLLSDKGPTARSKRSKTKSSIPINMFGYILSDI